MKLRPCRPAPFCLLAAILPFVGFAADPLPRSQRATVKVTHELFVARAAETITVPWSRIAAAIPGALLQQIAVRNSHGQSIPYQVTNIAPQAKDPQNLGVAYGELIFQHDFAAGEKSATFTIERTSEVSPVFATKAYARYIPERLDDFGWENDKIAHRTYGPALAAPAQPGTGKEVLVTSGIDVWCKRVSYPIVDRWYNKGHDHYHQDEGEGMDMYQVGASRGCGGTGIWDGQKLHVGRNYQTWRILANGPVRTVFELTYDTWDGKGAKISETKRFTVDAGHNLDQIESTFHVVAGTASTLTVAVGLNKNPADKGQEPQITVGRQRGDASITQWIAQKSNGSLGTAIVIFPDAFTGFTEDDRNLLALARIEPGQPLKYLAGAGWSKAGEFTTREAWEAYVALAAARLRSPLTITVNPTE